MNDVTNLQAGICACGRLVVAVVEGCHGGQVVLHVRRRQSRENCLDGSLVRGCRDYRGTMVNFGP